MNYIYSHPVAGATHFARKISTQSTNPKHSGRLTRAVSAESSIRNLVGGTLMVDEHFHLAEEMRDLARGAPMGDFQRAAVIEVINSLIVAIDDEAVYPDELVRRAEQFTQWCREQAESFKRKGA